MINAAPMQVCTPAVSELYNITVTCTIHPDSTADHCVVMAMADVKVTRTGDEIQKMSYALTTYTYVRTYVLAIVVLRIQTRNENAWKFMKFNP